MLALTLIIIYLLIIVKSIENALGI